ncbi:MAG TPA: nucleotidyltransferase domain-containing protein [Methanotrichaceae archaeon]|nr:nucleotidyltransferase domain-containing protein [Methanotrichaceae archaeon]
MKEHLRKFKRLVEKRFRLEKMILFGSRARDDWLYTSDVDLILVSENFQSMNFLQRMREISLLWDCDLLLEPLCYTPEEFERKKGELGIVRNALKYGIEI